MPFWFDTLSLARMGLNVTGVDFSDEAIIKAKALGANGFTSKFCVRRCYEAN